jgi:uncharacterized protein
MRVEERIATDLKVAMKARRRLEMDVLRYLKHVIAQASSDRVLREDEVLQVLWRHAKSVRETLDIAADARLEDHADAAIGELEVIARYLPPPMTEIELRSVVSATIRGLATGAPPTANAVMNALLPSLSGRIDLGRAHEVVREILATER